MADPSEAFCYYRVLHDYTPPDEYLDKGYLTIVEGDLIEVPRPVELEQGTEKFPEGWLKGKNTKYNLEGYFPSGDYVQYIEKNPVLRKTASTCKRRHSTKAAFFVRPILCSNCQDYIWGTGAVGVICKDCGQCFHSECESDAVSFGDCSKSLPAKQHPIFDQPVPLSQWDVNNVADWMAVVNLHRYAHIFMKYGKKGDDLSNFTLNVVKGMKIEDEFHQKSILACVEKLCSNNKTIPKPMVDPEGASKDHHNFSIYSFSSMQQCHLCSEYLWGIIQQGYQCRNCGLCCHRKCVVGNLPKCSPEKLKHLKRSSFMLDAIFGMPLMEQFDISSSMKAPPVVIRFTQELEKQAQDRNIKAADAYRLPASTAEVNRLKRHISEVGSIEDANLESFDHVCIAGALKKYLRDLPNAVIHEDFYSRFVEESKNGDDERCKKNLMQLVEELPPHHCTTLKFLLEHFTRSMQLHSANDDKKDAVGKLSRVFCQILIRPPWDSIIEIVFSAEASLRVISLLLQSQLLQSSSENLIVGPSGPSKPPPTPVFLTESLQPCYGSIDVADWYWKDISKEELNERMSNTQDGTFLVRDSSDGVKDNYTLALRKGGSNRLLKIYHRDGKFGLMEPLSFTSVISLVNHYMQNSLLHFNKTLDIKLQSPICRPKQDFSQEDPRLLKVAYVKADKEYNEELKRFEKIHEEHALITEELIMRHQALDAFRETLLMFDENMKIVMKNQRLVPQSEVVKARDNFELLQRQSKSVAERVVILEKEIKQLAAENKVKFKDMNIIRPDLQSKGETRDQLRQRLINHGETPQKLDQLVLQEQNAVPEEATSHSDTSTWLVNFDRKKAVELLVGRPDGTFLIRPRNEHDWPYGLTIVSNGEVVHCKIGKKETGYGFADPFFIHETLSDLVMHYKDTSLVEHNDVLDVMLEFPALGTVFTKQSNQIQTLPDMDSANHSATFRTMPPAIPSRARKEHNETYVL